MTPRLVKCVGTIDQPVDQYDQQPKHPDACKKRDQPRNLCWDVVNCREQAAKRHDVGDRDQQNEDVYFFEDRHGVGPPLVTWLCITRFLLGGT